MADREVARRPSVFPFPPAVRGFLLLLPLLVGWPRPGLPQAPSCSPTPTVLCLQGSRFQAEVTWAVPGLGTGAGQAVPLTADTGLFWFFSSSNTELVVKVLDGRAVNRHFWVFYGALSNVDYTLKITDLETGAVETFHNPGGRLASASNVAAFLPESPSAGIDPGGAVAAVSSELPLRRGPELQVNQTSFGDQWQQAVAVAPDGSSMVVWASGPSGPGGGTDIYGRVYGADGTPRTGEILINEVQEGNQSAPRVAAGPGGFMVVWSGNQTASGRLFGADGRPASGELPLTTGPEPQYGADVVADSAGGFLAAWGEGGTGASSIHAQRFNAQGNAIGGPSSLSTGDLDVLRLAALPQGGFVAAWDVLSPGAGTASSDIHFQLLDAAGQPRGSQSIAATSSPGEAHVVPVAYADGSFSLLWNSGAPSTSDLDAIWARRYDALGAPAGEAVRIRHAPGNAEPFSALSLPSGDTWVLWTEVSAPQDPDGGVFSGVFDRSWSLAGDAVRFNTYTLREQERPEVAAAPGGGMAVWTSGSYGRVPFTQDGVSLSVFGQRFTLGTCALDAGQLCLAGRFQVEVQVTDPRAGAPGPGHPVPLTSDTGAFWFFQPSNVELVVKVLDGRAVNGHFWVFYGALSDVEYTITVTDTVTGDRRTYHNNPHHQGSGADVGAFAVPAAG
ncbi:MAG TPA: hypothetical protein VGP73_10480 [Thermoanaerobaculia bacterium]